MPDTKEIIRGVKKLEIKTKHLVDGLLQGAYHSVFKGRGIEFSESREYIPGDDIRSIDWNVTARMNHPYVKEFIEERDLTIYIVFDISASNNFGYEKAKSETAVQIAASVMFAAFRNNDNIGMLLFTDRVEKFMPARKGKKHLFRLIRDMVFYQPKGKTTDIRKALAYLSRVLKKRSIVFIISDFIAEDFTTPLRILKYRHEIIMVDLIDMRETRMPDVGLIELEDEETGEQLLIDTSDPEFRKEYERMAKDRVSSLSRTANRYKIDMIPVRTDEPFEVPLQRFFRRRK
ncbi:MAG: DUF58 domain-containing protein [archaeon]